MKKIFYTILCCLAFCGISSCSHDNEDNDEIITRTVLIYMSAENDLDEGNYYTNDIAEIEQGAKSLPSNVNLLVYADRNNKTEPPFIAKFNKNGYTKVKTYDADFYSTDKEKMEEITNWVFSQYPAESYAMTFWGHGSGWIVESDAYNANASSSKASARRRAYGYDSGVDNADGGDNHYKGINIPDFANVLSSVPHLDYIFFDCCQMQCAEVAYELKDVCDYVIASPSEIPGLGAPYNYILKDLFLDKANVGKAVIDDYINNSSLSSVGGLPFSVVKTSEMSALATATASALDTVMVHYQYPTDIPTSDLIYYGCNYFSNKKPIFFGMRDFMHKYLSDTDFQTWDKTFQNAVIYSVIPQDISESLVPDWKSNQEISIFDFSQFKVSKENYGGMSMFIPQTAYESISSKYLNPNSSIQYMKWSKIVDWTKWGWE